MIRQLALVFLLFLPVALVGCSDGNSNAPSDSSAHPQNWLVSHHEAALDVPDFDDCIICHGADLKGSGDAVSCYSCHSFNSTPPFSTHPIDWSDTYINHRNYTAINGTTSCNNCHGSDLLGTLTVPSCFSSSFDGRTCHSDGPGVVPHPLDGTYLSGINHGPDAKADLTVCQACHGESGGAGSNPRFNKGIDSISSTGCEGCHGVNYAHPADWAGPNATFHYSAGNIQTACTLCHGADLLGGVGINCLNCHATTTTFTLDCMACHSYPPDSTDSSDIIPIGVNHFNVASISLHNTCVKCHGMKESTAGGSFEAASNYLLFDKSTDTIGDHWNGKIGLNSATGYNQSNFGCDTAGCHANDPSHQLSGSGLPVELKNW